MKKGNWIEKREKKREEARRSLIRRVSLRRGELGLRIRGIKLEKSMIKHKNNRVEACEQRGLSLGRIGNLSLRTRSNT